MPPPIPERASWAERLRQLPALRGHIRRTFAWVWRSGPSIAIGLAASSLCAAGLPPAMAWVAKLIVDAVVATSHGHGGPGRSRVLMLVGVELALMLAATLQSRLSGLLRQLMGTRLANLINTEILEKALQLEVRHFEDADLYDKMQNARREAGSRPLSMILGLVSLGQNTIMVAVYSAMLWRLAWWSAILIAAASIPSFIAEARMSGEAFRLSSWRAPESRRQNYLEWILTRDSAVREVKLFGLGPLILGRYKEMFTRFYAEDRGVAVRRALYGVVLGGVSMLVFYGAYAFLAVRAADSEITLGDLTLYLAAFRQGQDAIQSMLGSIGGLYEDGLFLSNLFGYLDVEPGSAAPGTRHAVLQGHHPRALELKGVTFRYPGADRDVLKGIDLTVAPGETLALCGDNGAGKSTLIQLMLGLYQPTAGQILYGGIDLRDLDPQDYRTRVGALFQAFVRYQFTVAENIGLGDVGHLEDRPRIEGAADQAGARAMIQQLPAGFETMLGGWFESGQELSGGQWQKVALARAFMRRAELLVLDEPSASLDAEAEHDLFLRLRDLAEGRTAVLVSHRLSTLRMADRIALIREGSIEELGSHAELMTRNARYAHLFSLQAEGYRGN